MSATRGTIGILTNHIGGPHRPYEKNITRALTRIGEEYGHRLVFYSGGFYKTSVKYDHQRNFVYDLALNDRPDGILALSSLMGEFIDPEEIAGLLHQFKGIPVVSAGMMVRGIPSVAVDNYRGMRLVATHMIRDHGVRRIAYLNGPLINFEAWDRLKAFTDVMKENDLPLDPGMIFQGDYYRNSGREAARALLEKGDPFDAMISANDEMAFGFMEYMEERGVYCPKDYLASGFDNNEMAELHFPPLTTVSQDTFQLGLLAGRLLCRVLNGETIPEETWAPTTLVVRSSCGCPDPEPEQIGLTRSQWMAVRRDILRDEQKEAVLQDISQELINTATMDQLKTIMEREFPRLEILSCNLCTINPNNRLSVLISWNRNRQARLNSPDREITTTEVIPEETGPYRIIEAVNFRENIIGVLIFEVERIQFSLYSPLREQISSTMNNILNYTRFGELNSRLQSKLDHLSSLRTIDIAITESRTPEELLSVLLEQVILRQQVDAAAILLYHPGTDTLEFAAGSGFRTGFLRYTRLKPGESLAGSAALDRKHIFIGDLRREGQFNNIPLFASEEFIAYCAAPLSAHGELKGVLELFHRSPLDPDQEWHDFLAALAGQAAIALDNTTLLAGLKKANSELAEAWNATLEGWSRALELRDHETEGHCLRVARHSVELGRRLGLDETALSHLYRGALLHDIGKVAIPDAILLKPGPLTDEEMAEMKKHPDYAWTLLAPIRFLEPSLDIPWCHHEKWDGTGYPRGLKGEQIPLFARIFAVIDVADALSSERPYRGPWPSDRVREHIASLAGSHFDPEIVRVFLTLPEVTNPSLPHTGTPLEDLP